MKHPLLKLIICIYLKQIQSQQPCKKCLFTFYIFILYEIEKEGNRCIKKWMLPESNPGGSHYKIMLQRYGVVIVDGFEFNAEEANNNEPISNSSRGSRNWIRVEIPNSITGWWG